jgi:N6-adenosine-specific RNA methylase IME4
MKYRTVVADPPWQISAFPPFGAAGGSPVPYATMTIHDIGALPVAGLAAPGAHLYLWAINAHLWNARMIAELWGARVIQVLTWCKSPMGLGPGAAFASTTEFILFCRFRVGPVIRAAREAEGMRGTQVDVALGNVRSADPSRGTELCRRWEEDSSVPTLEQWDALRRLLPDLAHQPDITPEPVRHPTCWFQWKRGAHSQKPEHFLDLVEQVSPGPYVELFARRHRMGWDVWGNESANTATLGESA